MFQGLNGDPGEAGLPGLSGPPGVPVRARLYLNRVQMFSTLRAVWFFLQGSPGFPGLPGEKVSVVITPPHVLITQVTLDLGHVCVGSSFRVRRVQVP